MQMLTKRWSHSESVQLLLPPTSTTCNIYNSNHPSIPLSTHPSINVAIYPSSHPSNFIHPSIPPSINIPIHASIHPSIHIPINPQSTMWIPHWLIAVAPQVQWILPCHRPPPLRGFDRWKPASTHRRYISQQATKNGLTDVSVYYNVVWCCAYLNGQQRHCFRDYYT